VRLEGTPLKVIVCAVTGLTSNSSVRPRLLRSQSENRLDRADLIECFSVH
jgi:hypothetical protein